MTDFETGNGGSAGGRQPHKLLVAACYVVAIFIAYTFVKYLYFKFVPNPDANSIFRDLETWTGIAWVNPYFRFFTGGVELVASILLFIPGLQVLGALLTVGTLTSAILLHLVGPIGIEGARGDLFMEAVICTVLACGIIFVRRHEIPRLIRFLLLDPSLYRLR